MMKAKTSARPVRGGREVESRLAHVCSRGPMNRSVVAVQIDTCGEPRMRARRERIKRIRRNIAAGTYLTESRLSYAIEKMLDRLAQELRR